MRKFWVAILGAALLVSSWGGATSASSPHSSAGAIAAKGLKGCTAKGTISFMFWGDKGEKAEQDADVALAEKSCPGLHVDEIWDQGNYDNDIATKIGSGNAPDVFQLNANLRIPQYASQGALAPLDSYVKRDHVNLGKIYWGSCLPMNVYKGHVYGLLRDCGSQGILFYNKDMFDARHVPYPTNKWTLTDLRAAAVKLTGDYTTKTDPATKLRFGYAVNNDEVHVNMMVWNFGGDVLSKNLKQCTLDSKQSQAALNWWRDLSYKYHGAPTSQQQAAAGGDFDGFRDQHYAMGYFGPWALDYVFGKGPVSATTRPTFRYGAVIQPQGPKGRKTVMAAGSEVVYSGSKNKNAAWWLTRFLTQGKPSALGGRYGIVIPGDKLLINDPGIKKTYGPILPVIIKNNKTGRPIRALTQHDKFWSTVSSDLTPFWQNQQSAAAATQKACADVQSLLP